MGVWASSSRYTDTNTTSKHPRGKKRTKKVNTSEIASQIVFQLNLAKASQVREEEELAESIEAYQKSLALQEEQEEVIDPSDAADGESGTLDESAVDKEDNDEDVAHM